MPHVNVAMTFLNEQYIYKRMFSPSTGVKLCGARSRRGSVVTHTDPHVFTRTALWVAIVMTTGYAPLMSGLMISQHSE